VLVSLEVGVADPTLQMHRRIVGADVSQRYLAVATDMANRTQFYAGKQVRAKANRSTRLRRRLQQQGARAATRRLIVVSRTRETGERDGESKMAPTLSVAASWTPPPPA
jgi:hypothetical protein